MHDRDDDLQTNGSGEGTPAAERGTSHEARPLAFRSLDAEVQNKPLGVDGTVPSWLEGSLLRTGPAKFEVGDRSLRHWFDGLAMLHRFAITDGDVCYSNKFLQSQAYTHAVEEGTLGYREFATDPCRRIWERFFSLFTTDLTDNANVNISKHAEQFVSLTETTLPVAFDPETLDTLGVVRETEREGNLTTAHPHVDDGYTFNYVTDFSRESVYRLYRTPRDGDTPEQVATIPRDRPAYMHSFGLTERYVLLVEFPLVVNPLSLLLRDRPFIENYRWRPERGTRFLVIDRETGDLVSDPTASAFFAFHHVNAFEDGNEIVVDIVAYDDPSIVESLYLDELRAPEFTPDGGRLVRYRVGDGIARQRLYPEPVELPRINYGQYNTAPYRYVYAVGNRHDPPRDVPNRLVKVDVGAQTGTVWEEPGTYPGEPVFVAAPDAAAEDDGVVLSVVLDVDAEHSFLLVLDATTFEELARATVPHGIPLGFHGNFYDV